MRETRKVSLHAGIRRCAEQYTSLHSNHPHPTTLPPPKKKKKNPATKLYLAYRWLQQLPAQVIAQVWAQVQGRLTEAGTRGEAKPAVVQLTGVWVAALCALHQSESHGMTSQQSQSSSVHETEVFNGRLGNVPSVGPFHRCSISVKVFSPSGSFH